MRGDENIFYSFASLFLGLLLLISGLFLLRFSLSQLLSPRIKTFLACHPLSTWQGFCLGIIAATLLQSSTAVTLILLGFISAGYLSFLESLSIILGANIGTCSTVQLFSISFLPQNLLFTTFSILLAFIFAKILHLRKTAWIMAATFGLCTMFSGFYVLSTGISEKTALAESIAALLQTYDTPLAGILLGLILTFLLQSSSAATILLIALAKNTSLSLAMAAYIVYGNNIGSCLSSLIVSTTAPVSAKQAAFSHFFLNFLGILFFLPLTPLLTNITSELFSDYPNQIAFIHTIFNFISSCLLIPFIKSYAKLIQILVPR
ncbi:MAG: Na/Pi symporter [Sporomusaceae bacterium]|nr:Na/Pi symporter [Sporomusaceae bacterium]